MSEKVMQKTVKEYLRMIKEKLPDWLKSDRKELRDIIDELEEHIWEKADELSGYGQPTEDSVRMAIAHMGSPESIAKEYKHRGTPKVYITAEMWPLYKKVLFIVFGVIVALNIFAIIMNFIFGDPSLGSLLESLSAVQLGFLVSFVVITVIFVVLSMEGYFPENFKSKVTLKKEELELQKAVEVGMPISKKTGKPLKPFISPTGEIIGGIIGLIFGIVVLIQPFPTDIFNDEFLLLLRFFGILIIVDAALNITRGLIGNQQPGTHQGIQVIKIFLSLAWIPFLVFLMDHPEIFPVFITPWVNIGIPPEFHGIYRMVIVIIIVIVALSPLDEIYKIVKLQKYKV